MWQAHKSSINSVLGRFLLQAPRFKVRIAFSRECYIYILGFFLGPKIYKGIKEKMTWFSDQLDFGRFGLNNDYVSMNDPPLFLIRKVSLTHLMQDNPRMLKLF